LSLIQRWNLKFKPNSNPLKEFKGFQSIEFHFLMDNFLHVFHFLLANSTKLERYKKKFILKFKCFNLFLKIKKFLLDEGGESLLVGN
jgi:hypothetical protein